MPSTTTSVMPSDLQLFAKASRLVRSSRIGSVIVSQPRRLAISGVPGSPQSVSSLRQIRWATFSSAACLTRALRAGSSSLGIADSIVFGRPVTTASRPDSTPARSFSNGVTNAAMPSRSSLSVTSVRSIPASASFFRSSEGSISAVTPENSDFSAAASRVCIGIVLTVCGATSVSTYLVSG